MDKRRKDPLQLVEEASRVIKAQAEKAGTYESWSN